MFQFTRPQGARPKPDKQAVNQHVSIHAPTRGATCGVIVVREERESFNSRAHKGRDYRCCFYSLHSDSFNSRAHKGRDSLILRRNIKFFVFQFTRPQGARLTRAIQDENISVVSIHAPTRGATRFNDCFS